MCNEESRDGMARIVLVEDDLVIRELVASLLREAQFEVVCAADGVELDAALARAPADLLILDWMLPDEDGLSICRRVSARRKIPILMLTAKAEKVDRVIGLETGADDYVVKPFAPRELLARVRAILRREDRSKSRHTGALAFDEFVFDVDTRRLATSAGNAIALTDVEHDLLVCFVHRPRRVLTRSQLLEWTRGRTAAVVDRAIDMSVSRLRRKLEGACRSSGLITTVRNGGYLFTAAVRRAQ
jgi:two-component system OmpR family response regulator